MEKLYTKSIENKNFQAIYDTLFNYDGNIKHGFRIENEFIDFKQCLPSLEDSLGWAEIAKDVLGFYNNKGGILVFGIKDDFQTCGIVTEKKLDSKIFNDKIRKYLGDKIWVEYQQFLTVKYTISILIIPCKPANIELFRLNSPEKQKGKCIFYKGGTSIRQNDSTKVISPSQVLFLEEGQNVPSLDKYEVNVPGYRILAKDYYNFIFRQDSCNQIMKGLQHTRCSIVTLIGIGGIGKTALATWAVLECYKRNLFEFIVSVSAKDRELTSKGILALQQNVSTLNDLLDAICETLELDELKSLELNDKRNQVTALIEGSKGLIFLDNLETVEDHEIFDFLNELPNGMKALVTSRRNYIKISNFPIEITKMKKEEIVSFIDSLSQIERNKYLDDLSVSEKEYVGECCDGIPLAIKWLILRSRKSQELLSKSSELKTISQEGAQLLEFSFRRIFDDFSEIEKMIVKVLALFTNITIEALIKGTGLAESDIMIRILDLKDDAMVFENFDETVRDNVYSISNFVRAYVSSEIIDIHEEKSITMRMRIWYEALDIKDEQQRIVIRETRQGSKNPGNALIELAKKSASRGDIDTALKIFKDAMKRDQFNPKVYWAIAEFYRHNLRREKEAVRYYEMVIQNISKGDLDENEKSIVYRELGLLYKVSGEKNASDKAKECFEKSIQLSPNDSRSLCALSKIYKERGMSNKVIELLKGFDLKKCDDTTFIHVGALLLDAYEKKGELLLSLEIKNEKQRRKLVFD